MVVTAKPSGYQEEIQVKEVEEEIQVKEGDGASVEIPDQNHYDQEW